jgi:hypothetical protein
MFILDSLLVGSLRFVLDKIAAAVEREMNDDVTLREDLLALQMRAELGEISLEELAKVERELLARLREIEERRRGESPAPQAGTAGFKVTGVEATVEGDEGEVEA